MTLPLVLINTLGKSLHVNEVHISDFLLSAVTALICMATSLEHVYLLCTTQTTTSLSWALKSFIRLMPGSGGKSFTS